MLKGQPTNPIYHQKIRKNKRNHKTAKEFYLDERCKAIEDLDNNLVRSINTVESTNIHLRNEILHNPS